MRFRSFREFYPFYLEQHRRPLCRVLHVGGVLLGTAVGFAVVATGHWRALWLVPVIAQAASWMGQIGFEKNRPATFRYPLWGFLGLLVMTGEALRAPFPNGGRRHRKVK
jgi:hypothetical protein